MIVEDFKKCLGGRSIKWFFDEKVILGIVVLQLN